MQDNKNLHAFDKDILQCRADILKALGTAGDTPAQVPPEPQLEPKQESGGNSDKLDILDLELTDEETAVPESSVPAGNDSPEVGHITPFESLPKRPLYPSINADALLEIEIHSEDKADKDDSGDTAEFVISENDALDIADLDSEEVHTENGFLKTTLEQMHKQLAEECKEKEKALDQLRAISDAVEPLRTANEQLERRLADLAVQNQTVIRESNEIHHGLLRSLEQEKAATAAAQANVQKLQAELQKVQKAREFLSESFSALMEQNQQLQSQLDALVLHQRELAEKSGQTEDLGRQVQQLESKLNDSEAATVRLHAEIAELTNRNEELLIQRDDLRRELETAAAQLDQIRESLENLQRQYRTKDDAVAQLTRQLEQFGLLEKDLKAVESQNHALRDELSKADMTLSQHQAKIRELESQVRRLTDEKFAAEHQTEQLRQAGQSLQTDEQTRRQEFEQLQQVHTQYRRQAEEEAAELHQRAETLSSHVVKLQQQAAEYKEQAERLEMLLQQKTAAEQTAYRKAEQYRTQQETLLAQLTDIEKKLIAQETYHENAMHTARLEKANLENELQQFELRQQETQKRIDALELKLHWQEETQIVHHERLEPDKRLETILEEEELSALMQPNDEHGAMEPASESTIEQAAAAADALPNDTRTPAFNLADLIMSEHRRSIGSRRQRVSTLVQTTAERGIRQVVEQYVKPSEPAGSTEQIKKFGVRPAPMWEDDCLTPFQRDILNEIIRKDIENFRNNRLTRHN